MTRKVTVLGVALCLGFAVFEGVAAAENQAQPPGTPPGSAAGAPGQGKRQGPPASVPAAAARPADARKAAVRRAAAPRRGKQAGHRDAAEAASRRVGRKRARHASPQSRKARASERAKAGKITICHATGSQTNPYVRITISRNGLNGHGKHSDDLIPAPSGECPASVTATATGSRSSSSVPRAAAGGGSDPVAGDPRRGLRGGLEGAGKQGGTAQPSAAGGVNGVSFERSDRPRAARGKQAKAKRPGANPVGGVLGATKSVGNALRATATSSRLPYTGLPLWVVVLGGLALLGAGLLLRRRSRGALRAAA